MTEGDQRALAELARQLGAVCGALTRPAVRAGLVDLLRQPGGEFSRSAVVRAHYLLGQVIAAVEADHQEQTGG
jgi:hypothetical protein